MQTTPMLHFLWGGPYQGFELCDVTIPANAKYRVTEALERLVRLYEVRGETEKADRWRKKLQNKAPHNDR